MVIIPAIDLRAGRCVRLMQGQPDKETVYSDDPVTMACHWQEQGAQWLHVVDLDGSFSGTPKNIDIIKEILSTVDMSVQVGGGIRELATIQNLFELGAKRVILGTIAIVKPKLVAEVCARYDEGIVVSIDGRNGQVAVEGWKIMVGKTTQGLALEMKELGVKRIVFTDIWRDGTLRGPNLSAIKEIAKVTGLKVIASGGISTYQDIQHLKELEHDGVEEVIVGKALYDGTVTLTEALAIARN